MPTRRLRLKRFAGSLRMRSRDNLNRLREKRLRPMGVDSYPALLAMPVLLGLIILVGWLRLPRTTRQNYRPVDLYMNKPLAGWAVRAELWESGERLETSLVYAEATWAELESEHGIYDFEAFEEKNHLQQWWAEGKRLILRIVCDRPGEAGHKDIPEWLVEKMGGERLAGRFYEGENGGGFAPDYSSLIMREEHRKLIAALAERYDGHPGVAYIEVGSLGENGEWTVDSAESAIRLPTSAVSREYAWHYTRFFDETLRLMRRPYVETQLLSVGLYNPSLGDAEETWAYLDVIELGGYDKQVETDLVAMPDFYNQSPSGAHISEETDLNELLSERSGELAHQIAESHLSYAVLHQDLSGLSDEAVSRLQEIGTLIGHNIWLRSAEWDCRLHAGVRSKVTLTFRNDGTAPLHSTWPVALALFDGEEMICRQTTELDSSMILTGDNRLTAWIDIPHDAEVGSYTLKLAILDPATGEPGLRLANSECDDKTMWMELGELKVIGGWRGF